MSRPTARRADSPFERPSLEERRARRARYEQRARGQRYPKALPAEHKPSSLPPVDAVAIVGCHVCRSSSDYATEMAYALDMLETLEPVSPLRLVQAPGVEELQGHCERDWAAHAQQSPLQTSLPSLTACASPATQRHSIVSSDPEEENTTHVTFFSGARDAVRRPSADDQKDRFSAQWPGEDKPLARNLLNKGYIVFADTFASLVEDTPCGALTGQYRTSSTVREPTLIVDAKKKEHEQRLAEVCHYLSLAEAECRPLFRRQSSDVVYGHASYEVVDASSDAHTDRSEDAVSAL